jgi:hypothetical protein
MLWVEYLWRNRIATEVQTSKGKKERKTPLGFALSRPLRLANSTIAPAQEGESHRRPSQTS